MSVKAWRGYGAGRYGQIHVAFAAPAAGPGDRRPVVCFHQSPMSGAQFSPFQNALAIDRLVLCPDTPGFGGSDAPPAPVTIPDYAAAMADLLDDQGFGAAGRGAVDIVGCHTGTLIGMALALARPDLVRKLVMPSIALFDAAERAAMKAKYGGPQPLLTDPGFVPAAFKASVIDGPAEMTPERRLALFAERLRSGTRSWYGPEASLNYDCEGALKRLEKPLLCVVLNEMLAANTRRAATLAPNAQLLDLSAWATHAAWDAAPVRLADAVRPFLDALEPGGQQ